MCDYEHLRYQEEVLKRHTDELFRIVREFFREIPAHNISIIDDDGFKVTIHIENKEEDTTRLDDKEEYLAKENSRLRCAGFKMASAALHVAREYDGVHRLMLAVSEWAKVIADEGSRGSRHGLNDE